MSASAQSRVMSGCQWIGAPVDEGGSAAGKLGALLGFSTRRIFWLTNIAEGQWRGRHAHRESVLATFAVSGYCRLTLDNGEEKQVVELRENGPGLVVGPWIWHDLFDFAPKSIILVAASTLYDESEYIRDYGVFRQEAAARRRCS